MNQAEFRKFATRLFTAFPDVWEWLQEKSPDPKGTQEVWRETLEHCRIDECLHVLDDWINGKRPVFKAYERGQIALMIRQSVFFDRDKEAMRRDVHGKATEYVKAKRGEYRPLAADFPSLGKIFREGQALRRRMLDGEITEEQMREQTQRLVDSIQ